MNFLFSLTLAGIAARLKTTVTEMIARAHAPMSDEHPPPTFTAVKG